MNLKEASVRGLLTSEKLSYTNSLLLLNELKMMSRDYRFLHEDEQLIWSELKEQEIVGWIGNKTPIRKSLFHQYPKAVRHFLSLFPNNYLDIKFLKDKENLKEEYQIFLNIFERKSLTEREILNYINDSREFLIGSLLKKYFNFGHHEAHVFNEFRLGTSFKADYLLLGENSDGWHFVFVELEAPSGSITLQNGDFGNVLRKGESQVKDWEIWLEENFNSLSEFFNRHKTIEKSLPHKFYKLDKTLIHFVVIAGRRKDFNQRTYRIRREGEQNRKLFLHYDNLIDSVKQLIEPNTFTY